MNWCSHRQHDAGFRIGRGAAFLIASMLCPRSRKLWQGPPATGARLWGPLAGHFVEIGRAMRAKTAVVLGAQWGDEGKGKIVDVRRERFSAVARYAGGHNAGHTVIIGGQRG